MSANATTKFHIEITVEHDAGLTDLTPLVEINSEGINVLKIEQTGRDILLLNVTKVRGVDDVVYDPYDHIDEDWEIQKAERRYEREIGRT